METVKDIDRYVDTFGPDTDGGFKTGFVIKVIQQRKSLKSAAETITALCRIPVNESALTSKLRRLSTQFKKLRSANLKHDSVKKGLHDLLSSTFVVPESVLPTCQQPSSSTTVSVSSVPAARPSSPHADLLRPSSCSTHPAHHSTPKISGTLRGDCDKCFETRNAGTAALSSIKKKLSVTRAACFSLKRDFNIKAVNLFRKRKTEQLKKVECHSVRGRAAMANSVKKIVTWPKVLLFGDSITQFSFSKDGCWGALLADYLTRRCDVIARGFSGYNTSWCKTMLPAVLDTKMASDVLAMTVFLGANDSNDFDLNPRQHVPLEEYKQNLKDIVEFSMSQGVSREKIILISPPAFDGTAWAEECKKKGKPMSKNNETTGVYARACCGVAKEMGTKCVDLYSEMMKAEDYPSYLNDGLHLSEKGSQLLFEQLQPIIDKLTSQLPVVWFPFWDQVDLDNVEKSLLNNNS